MKSDAQNSEALVLPLKLIKFHFYMAIGFIFLAILAGLTYSMQFLNLYPFPGIEFLSPGRVRMVHSGCRLRLACQWFVRHCLLHHSQTHR